MTTSKQVARREAAEDIAHLLALFAELDAEQRSEVMRAAVTAFAARVMPRETDEQREEWLQQLARDSMPRSSGGAGRLVVHASDYEEDAVSTLCEASALSVVLRTSHDDDESGVCMVANYRHLCSTLHAGADLPDIAECLGVQVDELDFRRLADDDDDSDNGRALDREAMGEAIDQRCAECCTHMVIRWRRAFFFALLNER